MDEKFLFWRIITALAHQDSKVTAEERDFILSKFDYIDFSEEHQKGYPVIAGRSDDEPKNFAQKIGHGIKWIDDFLGDFYPSSREIFRCYRQKFLS